MQENLEQQILNKLHRKNPQKLAIACSAGSDSTALLFLLNKLKEQIKGLKLAICHVNYGLRGEESDSEDRFLQNLSSKLEVPYFVHHASLSEKVLQKVGIKPGHAKSAMIFLSP